MPFLFVIIILSLIFVVSLSSGNVAWAQTCSDEVSFISYPIPGNKKLTHQLFDIVAITIKDPSIIGESIPVHVWSDTDPEGVILTATNTDPLIGMLEPELFYADAFLRPFYDVGGNLVRVTYGDTVYAQACNTATTKILYPIISTAESQYHNVMLSVEQLPIFPTKFEDAILYKVTITNLYSVGPSAYVFRFSSTGDNNPHFFDSVETQVNCAFDPLSLPTDLYACGLYLEANEPVEFEFFMKPIIPKPLPSAPGAHFSVSTQFEPPAKIRYLPSFPGSFSGSNEPLVPIPDTIYVVGFDNWKVRRYSIETGNPIDGTGKFLSANDGLEAPHSIIDDPIKQFYTISNFGTHEIKVFNYHGEPIMGGTLVSSIDLDGDGAPDEGEGGLVGPRGLASIYGDLYVASSLSNEVKVYEGVLSSNPGQPIGDGTFVSAGSGGLSNPSGLTIKGGDLIVNSFDSSKVLLFNGLYSDNPGTIKTTSHLPQDVPWFPTAATWGAKIGGGYSQTDLYVSSWSENKVYHMDFSSSPPVFNEFVAAGSAGLDGPIDLKFDPACYYPDDVRLDRPCHLYVTSYCTDEVLRYDGWTGQPVYDPYGAHGKFIQPRSDASYITPCGPNSFGKLLDGPTGIAFGYVDPPTSSVPLSILSSSSPGQFFSRDTPVKQYDPDIKIIPDRGIFELPPELKGKYTLPQLASRESTTTQPTKQIIVPSWIKTNAGWWADGQINDDSFVKGIKYLIKEDIMRIPETKAGTGTSQEIPPWIKQNADWWSQGQISDESFVNGVQWLIKNGIMKIG